jgi:hypothetical protein
MGLHIAPEDGIFYVAVTGGGCPVVRYDLLMGW